MKINGSGNGPIRPDAAAERGKTADKTEQNGGATTSRVDSVEISDAGRAKAAENAATREARTPRLQEIRDRIFCGAYDTDAVVAEVARRILDRGDLQPVPSTEIQ
jgi:anti-sigma28 factor (negative regulator of flagellin synthesis)